MEKNNGSNVVKTRSGFKAPHSYVIVIMLLIFVSLLTYIIPAGEYERMETETGITMVDKDSFEYLSKVL